MDVMSADAVDMTSAAVVAPFSQQLVVPLALAASLFAASAVLLAYVLRSRSKTSLTSAGQSVVHPVMPKRTKHKQNKAGTRDHKVDDSAGSDASDDTEASPSDDGDAPASPAQDTVGDAAVQQQEQQNAERACESSGDESEMDVAQVPDAPTEAAEAFMALETHHPQPSKMEEAAAVEDTAEKEAEDEEEEVCILQRNDGLVDTEDGTDSDDDDSSDDEAAAAAMRARAPPGLTTSRSMARVTPSRHRGAARSGGFGAGFGGLALGVPLNATGAVAPPPGFSPLPRHKSDLGQRLLGVQPVVPLAPVEAMPTVPRSASLSLIASGAVGAAKTHVAAATAAAAAPSAAQMPLQPTAPPIIKRSSLRRMVEPRPTFTVQPPEELLWVRALGPHGVNFATRMRTHGIEFDPTDFLRTHAASEDVPETRHYSRSGGRLARPNSSHIMATEVAAAAASSGSPGSASTSPYRSPNSRFGTSGEAGRRLRRPGSHGSKPSRHRSSEAMLRDYDRRQRRASTGSAPRRPLR